MSSPTISVAQAVVLGVVEGLTEFLPVSSTGHLTIAEQLMGIQTDADAVTGFTAVIQVGAIVAAILYFRADIIRIVSGWCRGLVKAEARAEADYRFGWLVIWGTVPIGIVGFLGKDFIKSNLRQLWIVGSPETVQRGIADLLEATQADELMITTMVHDPADRLSSFERVAALARTPQPTTSPSTP